MNMSPSPLSSFILPRLLNISLVYRNKFFPVWNFHSKSKIFVDDVGDCQLAEEGEDDEINESQAASSTSTLFQRWWLLLLYVCCRLW